MLAKASICLEDFPKLVTRGNQFGQGGRHFNRERASYLAQGTFHNALLNIYQALDQDLLLSSFVR